MKFALFTGCVAKGATRELMLSTTKAAEGLGFDFRTQREASASFRESPMVYMTRDSLRIVPPVFLDSREASPTKTLTQERASGLARSLWVAS